MKYVPRHDSIEAEVVHVAGIPLAVYIDGIPLAVPVQYLEMLFQRAEEPASVASEPPKSKAKAKAKPAPKARAKEQEPAAVEISSAHDEVAAALSKRPMTSGELVEALAVRGFSSGSVYQALSAMRKAGTVDTRPDDEGTRRNFLAARKAA